MKNPFDRAPPKKPPPEVVKKPEPSRAAAPRVRPWAAWAQAAAAPLRKRQEAPSPKSPASANAMAGSSGAAAGTARTDPKAFALRSAEDGKISCGIANRVDETGGIRPPCGRKPEKRTHDGRKLYPALSQTKGRAGKPASSCKQRRGSISKSQTGGRKSAVGKKSGTLRSGKKFAIANQRFALQAGAGDGCRCKHKCRDFPA